MKLLYDPLTLLKLIDIVGKPGHAKAGGRQKGTPNKVTADLREAIMHAFDKVGGEDYLVRVARKNPQVLRVARKGSAFATDRC